MAKAQNKKWALDTNVVMDMARLVDAALSLREIAQEQGYTLHISPTALEELFHLASNSTGEIQETAIKALRILPQYKIAQIKLEATARPIASDFSKFLRLN